MQPFDGPTHSNKMIGTMRISLALVFLAAPAFAEPPEAEDIAEAYWSFLEARDAAGEGGADSEYFRYEDRLFIWPKGENDGRGEEIGVPERFFCEETDTAQTLFPPPATTTGSWLCTFQMRTRVILTHREFTNSRQIASLSLAERVAVIERADFQVWQTDMRIDLTPEGYSVPLHSVHTREDGSRDFTITGWCRNVGAEVETDAEDRFRFVHVRPCVAGRDGNRQGVDCSQAQQVLVRNVAGTPFDFSSPDFWDQTGLLAAHYVACFE